MEKVGSAEKGLSRFLATILPASEVGAHDGDEPWP